MRASSTTILPKKHRHRYPATYRAVNGQTEKVPWVLPDIKADMDRLRTASAFVMLLPLQDCLQWLLAKKEDRKLFMVATPKGLFMPTRVRKGSVLNATAYFQAIAQRESEGLNCMA